MALLLLGNLLPLSCKEQSENRPIRTVDVYETKFGERKKRLNLRIWPRNERIRGSFTLIRITIHHLLAGTTIISECWKSHEILTEPNLNHLTVNDSCYVINPET
ncbi:LOW QUALITY PROTEIN: hypothetical protein HZS_4259 [Henneguya salminicola]|nr:LOW QUALITY PROTEIN: hypothetical protein HZS_4259 [Henneguya salminicola]